MKRYFVALGLAIAVTGSAEAWQHTYFDQLRRANDARRLSDQLRQEREEAQRQQEWQRAEELRRQQQYLREQERQIKERLGRQDY